MARGRPGAAAGSQRRLRSWSGYRLHLSASRGRRRTLTSRSPVPDMRTLDGISPIVRTHGTFVGAITTECGRVRTIGRLAGRGVRAAPGGMKACPPCRQTGLLPPVLPIQPCWTSNSPITSSVVRRANGRHRQREPLLRSLRRAPPDPPRTALPENFTRSGDRPRTRRMASPSRFRSGPNSRPSRCSSLASPRPAPPLSHRVALLPSHPPARTVSLQPARPLSLWAARPPNHRAARPPSPRLA